MTTLLPILIQQLVEKKMQLEQFKVEHPEVAEGVRLAEEYQSLLAEAEKHSSTNYIPVPILYPAYPTYPTAYSITCSNSTAVTTLPTCSGSIVERGNK